MLDTNLLNSFEDSFAEEFLDQYLSVMTDYVLTMATALRGMSSTRILESFSQEERNFILSQTVKISEIAIDFELEELYDDITYILEKLGA